MITLQHFCESLNDYFRIEEYKDFCPKGLQVEGKPEIKSAATAVSASLATIQAAVDKSVDALIVHHGMFWQGDSYVINGPKREKLSLLIENEISLLAYHLPMDAHPETGNNWKAAKEMGWTNLEPFGEMCGQYIGVKGSFPEISRESFQSNLEDYYVHPAMTALGGKENVTTAALISGGAYKSITEAAKEQVDCFITGNFDEPAWHMAYEERVNFFALGHSATERIGPMALSNYINESFNIPCEFIDIRNPF